jgi:alcohol dehydrogenase (cytochrome c)
MEGWFMAVDAPTGKLVWIFKTSSGIIGQPISFKGANGKQHIAVLSGVGGWAGVTVSQEVDTRDGTVGLGFANAMRDLPKYTVKGGMLHVFALP